MVGKLDPRFHELGDVIDELCDWADDQGLLYGIEAWTEIEIDADPSTKALLKEKLAQLYEGWEP